MKTIRRLHRLTEGLNQNNLTGHPVQEIQRTF
jgi:hypothetical protein